MLLNSEYLKGLFARGLAYNDYLATGTDDQRQRWGAVYNAAHITAEQKKLLEGFVRQMNVLVVSGIWCGDCVEQCPLLERIARAGNKINLHFIDRDSDSKLCDSLIINAGKRVPVAVFMAEDFALCSWYGDRSLTRYRRLAQRQLGPTCSTGLFVPDEQELALTMRDWLNEFERIQIMLRLSTRLRQKHQD